MKFALITPFVMLCKMNLTNSREVIIVIIIDIFYRMDQMFQLLDEFINSDKCIFKFKTIDYPTSFQQRLITNYFTMT